jgi:hypothetical protein
MTMRFGFLHRVRRWRWIALALPCALFCADASAMSSIRPPMYHVRLACATAGVVAAASGLTERRLCDEARTAIQELAAGQIDPDVTLVPGWTTFANPNKEAVFEECQKQGATSCGFDYDLLYRDQQIPIVEIDKDGVGEVDPEGVTVFVSGVDIEAGSSKISLRIGIVEPAFNVMPQQRTELPTVDLETAAIAGSLHAKLKLALARYFLPHTLNHIMAGVVARSRH